MYDREKGQSFVQWDGGQLSRRYTSLECRHTRSLVLSFFSFGRRFVQLWSRSQRMILIPLLPRLPSGPNMHSVMSISPHAIVYSTRNLSYSPLPPPPPHSSPHPESTNRCRPGAYLFCVGDYNREDDDRIRRRWPSRSYGVCRAFTYEACVPGVMAFCGVVIVTSCATVQFIRHHPLKRLQYGANRKSLQDGQYAHHSPFSREEECG